MSHSPTVLPPLVVAALQMPPRKSDDSPTSPVSSVTKDSEFNPTFQDSSSATDLEKHSALPEKAIDCSKEIRSSDDGTDRSGVEHFAAEKGLKWWQAAFYMIAYNISIGILALPKAFSSLGLIPGILIILVYALINYFTSLTVWEATQRYPIYAYPEILALYWGRQGERFGHIIQGLLQLFLMAVHTMIAREAIVALSAPRYVACGVWWTFLGAAIMFGWCLYRSLKDCVWLAMVFCASISIATVLTAVSVISSSSDGGHAFLPDTLSSPSRAGSGLATIIFAFTGHLAYPQIINEMAKPEDFPKALWTNVIVQVLMYTATACIIYWFAGNDVEAPALKSATGVLLKIIWAFALPTIVVAGVLPGMMVIKNIIRAFWKWRDQPHVPWENSFRAIASWVAIAAIVWTIAPVFAEVIPNFMGIVGVAGAFLGAWVSLCFPSLTWLGMDHRMPLRQRTSSGGSQLPIARISGEACRAVGQNIWGSRGGFWRNALLNRRCYRFSTDFYVSCFILGCFLCIFGGYGAIREMVDAQHTEASLTVFSCGAPVSR